MREDDERTSRGGGESGAVRSDTVRSDASGAAAGSDVASRLAALAEEPSPRRRRAERAVAALKLVRAEYVYLAALAAFAVLAVFAHAYAYFSWDVRATLALDPAPVLVATDGIPLRSDDAGKSGEGGAVHGPATVRRGAPGGRGSAG